MPDAQRSVARQVRDYLDGHPTVAEALRLGIANHSAVARRIAEDLGWTTTAGVIAACRRYPSPRRPGIREEGIHRVLRKSRIETRTKVATVTVVQGIDVLQALGDVVEELLDDNALCRVIQVSQGTVIIVDEDSVPRVTRRLRDAQVIDARRGRAELAVTSPDSVEETPGLLAFLAGVLSTAGVNIVQAMSCYTDTIFILGQPDLNPAISALTKALA